VIGVTFVVVTATPFKVSFNTLPAAATGVVPEANGAAGCSCIVLL
jgi:hypothetical protein